MGGVRVPAGAFFCHGINKMNYELFAERLTKKALQPETTSSILSNVGAAVISAASAAGSAASAAGSAASSVASAAGSNITSVAGTAAQNAGAAFSALPPKAQGAVALGATAYAANLFYKQFLSPNDRWRYENFEIVNSIVNLKGLTSRFAYLKENYGQYLEGNCYGLTVNYSPAPDTTYIVALNNLGTNGSVPVRLPANCYSPFFFKNADINLPPQELLTGKTELVTVDTAQRMEYPRVFAISQVCDQFLRVNPTLPCTRDSEKTLEVMIFILTQVLLFNVEVYTGSIDIQEISDQIGTSKILSFMHCAEENHKTYTTKLWTSAICMENESGIQVVEIDSANTTCTRRIPIREYRI